MRFTAFFTILFFGTLMLSAQTITEHGYRFVNHTNKVGIRPQRGESALFQVEVFAGTTLLNSSKKNPGGQYRYEILSPGTETSFYPPMHDASLLMAVGDSATIYQAVDSTMRRYFPPQEQNAKELRFELVLREIISVEAKMKAAEQARVYAKSIETKIKTKALAFCAGTYDNLAITLPSGVKIYVDEAGKGAKVQKGEAIQAHYFGLLKNGTPFDNSYERREPLAFAAGTGQMIAGFDEGTLHLRHGDKAYILIPWHLGYGDSEAAGGSIPPKSDLVFFLDLF
jgi:FKBP-type peptidyl-prolyl cis-trans isomerase FkpA